MVKKPNMVGFAVDNAGGVTQDIEHTKNGWERAIATWFVLPSCIYLNYCH